MTNDSQSAVPKTLVVLGGGRVGAAIARDLADDEALSVTLADASPRALEAFAEDPRVRTLQVDLGSSEGVARAVEGQSLAVGAVPGPMGFATARAVLEAGVPLCDISFFEEDAFELDSLARERGLVCAVDCGVAPGLSNLMLGHAEASLERIDRFACAVGGLPIERHAPWEYKAPFSPIDVIAEYTRPARLREGGHEVVRPALSRPERMDFAGIGTLEAFETDGLRSLLQTSSVPDMVEKTLRYPGHRERIELLRDAGFLSEEPVEVATADGAEGDGAMARVRPVDLAAELLFRSWHLGPDDEELTVMRVEIDGVEVGGDRPVRWIYDLLDRTDLSTGTSSMARTTGYTCTAIVQLIVRGRWSEPGVAPPERIGREPGCFDAVLEHLATRGVAVGRRVERGTDRADRDDVARS